MFPLFAHHHLTYYCLLPYSSQTRIALHCVRACVRALVRSLQASSLGIKVGDMLLWPNSGGLAAPYHEFASLAHNAEQRPLVVEVERLDEDGTNEACPFQFRAERDEKGSDVDKRRSAMETFKQEGGKTIEVVMSTSVFGSRKIKDSNCSKSMVDYSKIKGGGYFTFYEGTFGGNRMPIQIKQLKLHGDEKDMVKTLQSWSITTFLQSKLSHPNVLSLLYTCFDLDLIASIYHATTSATLLDVLATNQLNWEDASCCYVAECIASGMDYIHRFINRPHG